MDQASFTATVTRQDNRVTVVVTGDVDMATADAMVAAATGEDAPCAVLDLRGVTFFDSAAIHALIRIGQHFAGGIRVMPSARVRRILELAGLADQWPIDG